MELGGVVAGLPSQVTMLLFRKPGLKKTRPFRFLLLKRVVLDWFTQFLLISVVVHLPKFGSPCEEPCESYKIKSDVLESPVMLMRERKHSSSSVFSWHTPI